MRAFDSIWLESKGMILVEKIRVLAVDDNPAILKLVTDHLSQKSDIEIVGSACDGLEALGLIDQIKPDVVLLDIIMPRMDGFSVLDALSSRTPRPRVIMLTGLSRDDFIARAMRLGASYYLVKPIDPDLLYARVREIGGSPAQSVPAQSPARRSDDEAVTNLFLSIGIPAHIKGYAYLREAVKMVLLQRDLLSRITKELYPGIARRFETTPSKVERAMRHAIEVAWNRGRLDAVNRLYGCKVFSQEDKPTNGEFIAMVADKIGMAKSA